MSNISKKQRKQCCLKLDEDLYKRLTDYRWEHRKSLNKAINDAIRFYLDNRDENTDSACKQKGITQCQNSHAVSAQAR